MKKNISIAFKGQLYKNEAMSTNYVYPQAHSEWAMLLGSDPRKMISDLNINGDHSCYTIKITDDGIIYAYRRVRSGRSGSNCAMVMLLASGPTRDGKQLTEKMHELLSYAMNQTSADQIDKNYLEEKMSGCEELFDFRRAPQSNGASEPTLIKEAYRLYKTNEELSQILENPYQPAYKQYRCIHIIPDEAGASPSFGSNVQLIDKPIEKVFFFKFPQGVEEKNGKCYVGKNEYFTLIYKRDGYEDYQVENLRISRESNVFSVENDIVHVATAETAKIKFSKFITFKVLNDERYPIGKFTIKLKRNGEKDWIEWERTGTTLKGENGERRKRLDDGFYEYVIESMGCKPEKGQVDTKRQDVIDVILKPLNEEQDAYLIPAFYNKKKYPNCGSKVIKISYKKDDILYKKYNKLFGPNKDSPKFYIMQHRPKVILLFACVISLLIGFGSGILLGKQVRKQDIGSVSQEPSITQPKEEPGKRQPVMLTLEQQDEQYLNSNSI